jgi:hypothetical protein
LGCIDIQRPFWLSGFLLFFLWASGIHEEIALGALGHILVAEPSCLAGSTRRYYDFAFLHKILLAGCMDEWRY